MATSLPPLPAHTEARLKGILEKSVGQAHIDSPEAALVRHEIQIASVPDQTVREQLLEEHYQTLPQKVSQLVGNRYFRAHNHVKQEGLLDPRAHTH